MEKTIHQKAGSDNSRRRQGKRSGVGGEKLEKDFAIVFSEKDAHK